MKALVFLLVLGNLLFYAFAAGYFGTPDNPDAGRVAQQVQPERIRIVAGGEPPTTPRPAATPSQPAEMPVDPATPPAAPALSEAAFCQRWSGLSVADADRLAELLGGQLASVKLTRLGQLNGWWVLIPPLADRAAASKKGGELRGLGVEDYFVIQDGPNRNAISLGVFSTEKGAQERLAALKERGVRSARVGLRPDKDGTVQLELRGPAAVQAGLDAALARSFPGRTGEDCR